MRQRPLPPATRRPSYSKKRSPKDAISPWWASWNFCKTQPVGARSPAIGFRHDWAPKPISSSSPQLCGEFISLPKISHPSKMLNRLLLLLNHRQRIFARDSGIGMAIGSRKSDPPKEIASDDSIKNACDRYISTKVMPDCLKQIHDALLLKPTSIRNEENFSSSSNFMTDKRMRMSCQTLDDYCFLKSYYIQMKKQK